ncbi:MAG: hypothetical protein RRB12_02020 [Armatimonadota bacterium]|nr:hypothetical protein [Armatimonadota bacterium]
MSIHAVEIRDLTVFVDKYPIVRGLNLTIAPAEWAVFVGHPSDLRRLSLVLMGSSLPEEGEIFYYNEPPRRALERNIIELWSPATDALVMMPSAPILLTFATLPLSFTLFQTFLILTTNINFPSFKSINQLKIIDLTKQGGVK